MPPTLRSRKFSRKFVDKPLDRKGFRGNSSTDPRSRKFSRKFVEKIRCRTSFRCRGPSGKSRTTRCQNSSLLRHLATPTTSKKRFGKNYIFLLRKSVFRHLRTIVIYGPSYKTLGRSIDRIEMNIESIESKKRKMQLLKELSRASRDSFESDSDWNES